MLLAAALLAPLALVPQSRDDFPVYVWRLRHRGQAPPAGLLEPFGGTNRFRGEPSDWIRAAGWLAYTTNAAGRDDLHLDGGPAWEDRVTRWIERRDPTALQREPCLSDPATRARLFATLEASLDELGDDSRAAVALGDEVSLTPYGNPLDLCRAPVCEARWKTWAEARGLPLEAPTTDDVRLALTRGDDSAVGPWLARRRFHHGVVHDLLDELAARTRGRARAGLLGITHETAFGGLSIDRAVRTAEFLECYPVGAGRELLHTWIDELPERRTSLLTLHVGDDPPERLAHRAREHWLRGGDGLILWHDAFLEDRPERASALAAAVADLRRLGGRYPGRPLRYGAAVLHDADSIAWAWLRDVLLDGPTWPHRRNGLQQREGTRERKVDAWLRLFEDVGLLPGAVSVTRLDASVSERFPVLVAPELGILSDDDLRALQAHLARGGVLVVDGPLGERDREGRRRGGDVVARLARGLAGRVVVAPPAMEGYLGRRSDPQRGERLRGLAREWLRSAGVPRLGLELGPAMRGVPWLVALRPLERTPVCAPPAEGTRHALFMLPNPGPADGLDAVELDLGPPPGYRLERRWPPEERALLRAGEMGVWELVPDGN